MMETQTKIRPILFSTPMVQAILNGRKTMTRRVVKENNIWCTAKLQDLDLENSEIMDSGIEFGKYLRVYHKDGDTRHRCFCKYEIGDVLWVRETWHPKRHSFPIGLPFEYKATAKEDGNPMDEPWKPSIFMPKEACRLFLKITNVRVERLQDITEGDAIVEGVAHVIDKITGYCGYDYINGGYNLMTTPYNGFRSLWKKINGAESWEANPWVWVIEFERVERPEGFLCDSAAKFPCLDYLHGQERCTEQCENCKP